MQKKQSQENTKQVHNANIIKSLEHRLEVARANGQTSLVNQLEAERNYYLK